MDNHQAPGMNSRRNRNSILQTAGDALGFRLNKRKRMSTVSSHGQSPSYSGSLNKHTPSIFDDVVLEISANGTGGFYPPPTVLEYAEEDSAEREARERLRDAAAQAVGLSHATTNTNTNFYTAPAVMSSGPHQYKDTTSVDQHRPAPAETHSGKSRGSMLKTTTIGPIKSGLPRYPGTLSSIQTHVQNSAHLLKYHASPSPFLILSRSKQWKTRYIVITSIEHKNPRRTEAHLHLFKAGAPDDRELERMRIHTKSIVYVADEEVGGGRQFVLKIGGNGVDSSNKDLGPTSWLLQMHDSTSMQRWIQIVKNAVLLQKAERDGPITDVYPNTYNYTNQEHASEPDMPASAKSFASVNPLPMTTTIDSGIENVNAGAQPNGVSTSLGPVSALNRLWNNRPTSRQLSVSGSSIATAFATPSLNSQASVHMTAISPPPPPISPPPLPPLEPDSVVQEVTPSRSRESMLYNLFRPTSPPSLQHQHQQQPSITHMSPPISPTASLPFTEDTVTSQSSTTIGTTRFSPNGTPRHAHHSSSFSVDWDAIDAGSLGGINAKRSNPVMQTGLAPPPRRRPLTGGGLPQRQSSPPKDLVPEEESRLSPSPIPIVSPLPLPLEDAQQSFEEEDGDVTMETALRGQGGQRSYFNDDDDDELEEHEHEHEHERGVTHSTMMDEREPLDFSPITAHSPGQDEEGSQRSAHLPSPLQRPGLQLSSASSFGATGSVKTAMHEHGSLGSRDDLITEEDHRDLGDGEGGGDGMNQFHLPSGTRRRSRLSSVPRQLSPPVGPPPPIPMFHSPPFPAVSPAQEYSSSERPGSSSSIPSTVPSLQAGGLSTLLSKRISTMSTDAPSFKSTESSGGGSINNSKLVSNPSYASGSRLSTIPGPLGPRSSAFPPPRPIPNVAPPPAPLDDLSSVGGHHRLSLSSFGKGGPSSPSTRSGGGGSGSASSRSEFVNRLTRYSVGPAGPPPTSALPPTPVDPDTSVSSIGGYSQAPPRNSMSSFSSNGNSNLASNLFTIPASPAAGKVSPSSSIPLPAMAPIPIRPLPPTPNLIRANDAERRPVSPSGLSTTSNRSARSVSAIPFVRMSTLKMRLRMMSNPNPIRGAEGNDIQAGLASIPPPQPPPDFPLPETPHESRQMKSQSQVITYADASHMNERGYGHHVHAHSYSTTPPITPPLLGETITSRLDHFPFGPGASTAQIAASLPNGITSSSASSSTAAATTPGGGTMLFASRALRTVMAPTPEITPLSPPPRRNSRASRDLTPLEKERWKAVVAGLEEESAKAVPYDGVPAKHSAINLHSFAD
ncbi:hypothetical protein M408DRAFT_28413 [Serendipita vermifera MAFF 305830]|uniref:PH domain-containing protein n=1 Tax=Serendipita vermifera MAFF 305830 TaxID=933852 RepID=A0A0C3ART7_SERVB|nr:hypothetical protein M408DRAFT_28413 [Serendipita vermifera MAFF 305830]